MSSPPPESHTFSRSSPYTHRDSALPPPLPFPLPGSALSSTRKNLADLVLWTSPGAPRRSDAVQIGNAFLCRVPDGSLVDSKYLDNARERDRRVMSRPQDPAGEITLLTQRQIRIERVFPQE
jgi:hypothetical protein